jgi:hypothetical protein
MNPPTSKVITLVKVLRIGCLIGEIFGVLALLALLIIIPFSDKIVLQKGARFAIYTGINRSLNLGYGVAFTSDPTIPGSRFPGSVTFGPFRLLDEPADKPISSVDDHGISIENVEGMVVFRQPDTAAEALSFVKWPIVSGVFLADLTGLVILELFRRMLASAERGDVFTGENIRYVRYVGFLTILSGFFKLMAAGMLVHKMAAYMASHLPAGKPVLETTVDGNLSSVVTGLMFLVLAEVFRHGLALKEDSSLTI